MQTSVAVRQGTSAGFDKVAQDSKQTRKVSINVVRERITTVISAGTELVGNITLKEGVKLDGDMRGTLTFGIDDGLGIISRSATLQGDLYGPRALIMGTIEGDVYVHGLLMLSPTALVMGNVYYDRLIVHDGAQISGSMHMNRARALPNHGQPEAQPQGKIGNVRELKTVSG